MFCPKCGKEIPGQAAFCPKCGAALSGRPSGAAPKKDAPPAGRASAIKEKIVKAAAARPKKDRKDKAGDGGRRIDKRKILLIAAVVVIAVLILLPKSPSSDAPDRNISSGTGQGTPDGTADENTGSSDDGIDLGKDGKRSLKGQSKDFKENYNYVFDHQSEIIALYYQAKQAEQAEIASSFLGSLNALRDVVAAVDPKIFDMIALDAAVDNADSFLGMHLIYSGVNAYFSDSELGRGLRDISEGLILSAVMNSSSNRADQIRKDELEFCGGNLDYALMQTRGTLDEILRQMDVDSGYNSAVAALSWYDGQLLEFGAQHVQADLDAMWNGNGDAKEAEARWEAIRGRSAAVQDCITGWNTSRNGWINRLLHDVGLDRDVTNFTTKDSAARIYAIFDRTGKQYGVFTATNLRDLTFSGDGSVCFSEGADYDAAVFRKVDRDGKTLVTYNGCQLGSSPYGFRVAEEGYYPIAPCGNILHQKTVSDFEHGAYQVLELVRPDGSSEELIQGRDIGPRAYSLDPYYDGVSNNVSMFYICGQDGSSDTYAVQKYRTLDNKGATVYVDMKTGTVHSEPEYAAGGTFGSISNGVNSQCFKGDWSIANENNKLYSTADPTKVVADLSAGGGVKRLFWDPIKDEYWVYTRTGYCYAMDKDFQYLHEPFQTPGELYDLSCFGVIVYKKDGNMGLYDETGKQLLTFPSTDVVGFMAGNFNIVTGEQLQLELTA